MSEFHEEIQHHSHEEVHTKSLNESKSTLEHTDNELESIREEFNKVSKERDWFRDENNSSRSELSHLREDLDRKQHEIEDLSRLLDEERGKLARIDIERFHFLEREFGGKEQEIAIMQQERDTLKIELEQLALKLEEISLQKEDLIREKDSVLILHEELNQKYFEELSHKTELENKVRVFEVNNQELKELLQKAQDESKEKHVEIEHLLVQVNLKESEKERLYREMAAMLADNDKSRLEVLRLQSRIQELNAQFEELRIRDSQRVFFEEENKKLVEELEKARNEAKNQEAENIRILKNEEKAFNEINAKLAEFERRELESNENYSQLEYQNTNLQTLVREFETNSARFQDDIRTYQERIVDLDKKVFEFKELFDDLKAKDAALREDLEKTQDANNILKLTVEDRERMLKDANDRYQGLEKRNSNLEGIIFGLKKELAQIQDAHFKLKGIIDEKDQQMNAANARYQALEMRNMSLQEVIATLKDKKSEDVTVWRAEIDRIRDSNSQLKDLLGQKEQVLLKAKNQIELLEKEVGETTKKLALLEIRLAEKESRDDQSNYANVKLDSLLHQKEQELIEAQSISNQMRESFTQFKVLQDDATKEAAMLRRELDSLRKEHAIAVSKLKIQADELWDTNLKVEKVIYLEKEVDQLKALLAQKNEEVQRLHKKLGLLNDELNSKMVQKNVKLEKDLKESHALVSQLEIEFKEAEARLRKNASNVTQQRDLWRTMFIATIVSVIILGGIMAMRA